MDTLVRGTLTELIGEHASDAWAVLAADGWLDALPGTDGSWPLAEVAAAVVDVAARGGHELAAGAHFAAAATLAESGRETGGRLAVLLGSGGRDGTVRGRLWGDAAAETVVVSASGTRTLGVVPARAVTAAPEDVLLLRDVAVRSATVEGDAVEWISTDPVRLARHEARIAWLLAVEALGAVADATERTIAYTRQREAFGHALSAQQSIQHRLVDMRTVDLLGAALVRRATAAWADGEPRSLSWAAGVFAGTRGVWAAEQAIQLHGGVGFTWELGLRRVLALAQRARLLLGQDRPARALLSAAAADRVADLEDWSLEFSSEI